MRPALPVAPSGNIKAARAAPWPSVAAGGADGVETGGAPVPPNCVPPHPESATLAPPSAMSAPRRDVEQELKGLNKDISPVLRAAHAAPLLTDALKAWPIRGGVSRGT